MAIIAGLKGGESTRRKGGADPGPRQHILGAGNKKCMPRFASNSNDSVTKGAFHHNKTRFWSTSGLSKYYIWLFPPSIRLASFDVYVYVWGGGGGCLFHEGCNVVCLRWAWFVFHKGGQF